MSGWHEWLATKGVEVRPRVPARYVRRANNQVSAELEAFIQDLLARVALHANAVLLGKIEPDASQFGIALEAPPDDTRSDKTLHARRRRAIAAGFVVGQEGEFETILLFDPRDAKQAALAIRLIGAKKIRQVAAPTDAQLRARALFSSKARSRRACLDQNTNAIVGEAR